MKTQASHGANKMAGKKKKAEGEKPRPRKAARKSNDEGQVLAANKPPARTKRKIDMALKTIPVQERSRLTYDAILAAASSSLAEVGIDRFNINLICERAELTPPAIYRYFPNKYAILKALGSRLMEKQDAAVFAWIRNDGLVAATVKEAVEKSIQIQERVNAITREEPGGIWIMRAMRSIQVLRDIRVRSRNKVADAFYAALRDTYKDVPERLLRIATRLTIEVGYAATEMVLEEPRHSPDLITQELSWMQTLYFTGLARYARKDR